ncbi:MAG: sulfite exporter TauE/SafE family protein [Clostridia bacterium]|nr:sulfite exporter TauE/SafE family protein [Clostridia bacterium]
MEVSDVKEWLLPFLLGIATGILSAWGVGGGTLLLLCMTLFLGVDQAAAQGINLLYFLPTAAVSLLYHRKNGYLDAAVFKAAAPMGTLFALAAAVISSSVDIMVLRKPFGLFLLYAGGSMLLQRRKSPKDNAFVESIKN